MTAGPTGGHPADVIRASIERARASGRARFVVEARALPIRQDRGGAVAGLRCLAFAGARDRFYWERVEAGEFVAAWEPVDELEGDGPDRFRAARAWRRDLVTRLDWIGAARPGTAPLVVGGFGFHEHASGDPDWKAFPAARFVLPGILVERAGEELRCTVFVRVEPNAKESDVAAERARRFDAAITALASAPQSGHADADRAAALALAAHGQTEGHARDSAHGPEYRVRSDRSHARFRAQVDAALAEIGSGRLAKLVLARSLTVDHDLEFDVPAFLERLRALYPSCTLVAVGRGRDVFLAATPETLVRVEGRRLETAALAGSAPRGRTPEEDERLAADLLASSKERAEHAHVVEALRTALGPRCEELSVPASPALRALLGIQHLESRIEGTLAAPADEGEASDVIELVEALHPTPAVAGAPRAAAAAWLRRHEGLERGWYAAPIGWLDAEGGGAFCVGLRSALIRNGVGPIGQSGASRARLFAGAGIVPGSLPEQELVETRIKLRALLAPLTEI